MYSDSYLKKNLFSTSTPTINNSGRSFKKEGIIFDNSWTFLKTIRYGFYQEAATCNSQVYRWVSWWEEECNCELYSLWSLQQISIQWGKKILQGQVHHLAKNKWKGIIISSWSLWIWLKCHIHSLGWKWVSRRHLF